MANGEAGPLDGFYTKNFIVGLILSICCSGVGLVLSIIGVVTAKDAVAKSNATKCLIAAIVAPFIIGVLYFLFIVVIGIGAGAAR